MINFTFEERDSDSPLVARIWRTQSEHAGHFLSQAATTWELVIWKYQGEHRITVRGPETRAGIADTPADAEFFGIAFKPGVFMPHLPVQELVDNAILLPEATGNAFWLQGAVWQLPDYASADTFVDRLTQTALLVADPVVTAVLEGQPPDLSPRSVQYRFLKATGLTQATLRQIERARQAANLLTGGVSILDTVYETGYYDQAHLTRSLKRFVGKTPAQITTHVAAQVAAQAMIHHTRQAAGSSTTPAE